MSAEVKIIPSIGSPDCMPETVYPATIWHFPLEDITVCRNKLLLVHCDAGDRAAAFFETDYIEEFPEPDDTKAFAEHCNETSFQFLIKNCRGRISEEFIDRRLGPFKIMLGHMTILGTN